MQSVCLLFAGRRGLDDFNMRSSIIRVPEVSRRINQAQYIFDQCKDNQKIDLYSYAQSSNTEFSNQPNLRVLMSAIVQIGLFDRYRKLKGQPRFMIGRVNGCSAMDVCTQKISFEEFVTGSAFFLQSNNIEEMNMSAPTLSGLSLEEYGAVEWDGFNYTPFQSSSKDCYTLIEELGTENIINQYIHIGPSIEFRMSELEKYNLPTVSMMNSIDTDPILSSFWSPAMAI